MRRTSLRAYFSKDRDDDNQRECSKQPNYWVVFVRKSNRGCSAVQKVERLWPKRELFWKFYQSKFYLLTMSYHAVKFEKSVEQILRYKPQKLWATIGSKLHLRLKWWSFSKFHFSDLEHFTKRFKICLELSLMWFISTYCPLSYCKVWKKTLEQMPRYRFA